MYVIDSRVFGGHEDFERRATNLASFMPSEEETDTCGHGASLAIAMTMLSHRLTRTLLIDRNSCRRNRSWTPFWGGQGSENPLDHDGQGSTSQMLTGINYMIRHARNNPKPKKMINMLVLLAYE